MKSAFAVDVPGYRSGETSLVDLIARRSVLASAPELDWIVDAAAEALFDNIDGAKSLVVLMIGQSDRDDTPGRSEADRRKNEDTASAARAEGGRDWLLARINQRAQAMGLSQLDDFNGSEPLFVPHIPCGASNLLILPTSERDRLFNRRLRIHVAGIGITAAASHEGQHVRIDSDIE